MKYPFMSSTKGEGVSEDDSKAFSSYYSRKTRGENISRYSRLWAKISRKMLYNNEMIIEEENS